MKYHQTLTCIYPVLDFVYYQMHAFLNVWLISNFSIRLCLNSLATIKLSGWYCFFQKQTNRWDQDECRGVWMFVLFIYLPPERFLGYVCVILGSHCRFVHGLRLLSFLLVDWLNGRYIRAREERVNGPYGCLTCRCKVSSERCMFAAPDISSDTWKF